MLGHLFPPRPSLLFAAIPQFDAIEAQADIAQVYQCRRD
jgi:hypothetical protein